MILGTLEKQLCDIQGRLFELSLKKSYDSPTFIASFMNSEVAKALDSSYDRLQWAGEEYLLAELNDESKGIKNAGKLYENEVMYWIGYLYRYWHYYKKTSSAEIYKIANEHTMNQVYLGFHTLDPKMAIDRLIESKNLKF